MEGNIQDCIEREITIRAPRERVYAALTDPVQVGRWFVQGVEGKIEPGERPIFDFGEYGRFSVYIVATEPHQYFSFRWLCDTAYIPGGFLGDVMSKANSLVEFHLETVPGGTRVRVVESGFAAMPAEIAAHCLEEHSGGWEYQLDRLQKHLE